MRDIAIFKSQGKVYKPYEVNSDEFEAIDFEQVFEKYFKQIRKEDYWRLASGNGFSINYLVDNTPSTYFLVNISGKNAIYVIAQLAKTNGWKMFDVRLGEMLDVDNPAHNGLE